jgi:hypothetical protein
MKVGGRVLRAGDIVKVTGQRGATFRLLGFDPVAGTVEAWGGATRGERRWRKRRTFSVDLVGTRLHLAGTEAADRWV